MHAGHHHAAVSKAGLFLAAFVGIFIGLALFTFDYAEGTSYLSNDPRACVNCHVMREHYDGWQKASHHAAATCNDCHVPQDFIGKYWVKTEHGYRHSKGFTFQDFHEPIQIKQSSLEVVEANCRRCHETTVSQMVGHGVGKTPGDCVHCHSAVGHGPIR